jgi:hypothetical protein
LGEFEERKLVEMFLEDCSDDVSQKRKFFCRQLWFASHTFENEVDLVDIKVLELYFGVVNLQKLVYSSCKSSSMS